MHINSYPFYLFRKYRTLYNVTLSLQTPAAEDEDLEYNSPTPSSQEGEAGGDEKGASASEGGSEAEADGSASGDEKESSVEPAVSEEGAAASSEEKEEDEAQEVNIGPTPQSTLHPASSPSPPSRFKSLFIIYSNPPPSHSLKMRSLR